jgi:MotA/TolQ/ExbB proton channel family
VWDAYLDTVKGNWMDWGILLWGLILIGAHIFGLIMRVQGKWVFFVQDLYRYQTFCLILTELLPLMGLLATTFSLMNTFKSFESGPGGKAPDLSDMISSFSPALSGTISGLLMVAPNLVLNGMLWLVSPSIDKEK